MLIMESFLRRWSQSTHPVLKSWVLRGSWLTRRWLIDRGLPVTLRHCEDLDFLSQIPLKEAQLEAAIAQLFSVGSGSKDGVHARERELGLRWETSWERESIWSKSPTPGVRYTFYGHHHGQREMLQVDISSGDPMCQPAAVETFFSPALKACLSLKVISVETALAWKIHGLFEFLHGNWRPKDLWDIYLLLQHLPYASHTLLRAVMLAFESREDPVQMLERLLYGDFAQSARSLKGWTHFQNTQIARGISSAFVPDLPEVLSVVRAHLRALIPLGLPVQPTQQWNTNMDVIQQRVRLLKSAKTAEAAYKLSTLQNKKRFLPHKAFFKIAHLPGSRTGPSDKTLDPHQSLLLTSPDAVDKSLSGATIWVHEKLDGSCVAVHREGDALIALGRAGDLATESPNPMRRLWAEWVDNHAEQLLKVLEPGERLVGEWLALVHGTHYLLDSERYALGPFVAFALMKGPRYIFSQSAFEERLKGSLLTRAYCLHQGSAITVADIEQRLGKYGHHGATECAEGAVWKIERGGKVLFFGKYVRSEKKAGAYLSETTGQKSRWNWHPTLNIWKDSNR